MKFRLMCGQHTIVTKHGSQFYQAPAVIETEDDLCQFNPPDTSGMPRKFERIHEDVVAASTATTVPSNNPSTNKPLENNASDTFKDMTEQELRAWAQSEGISLKGAKGKDDIIRMIENAPQSK